MVEGAAGSDGDGGGSRGQGSTCATSDLVRGLVGASPTAYVDGDRPYGGGSPKKRKAAAAVDVQGGKPGRTYLNCPYRQKDAAKLLGAKWDGDVRAWYVLVLKVPLVQSAL